LLEREITLRAIAPGDGDLVAHDLNILRRDHGTVGWVVAFCFEGIIELTTNSH
jgi:hypothetical protein